MEGKKLEKVSRVTKKEKMITYVSKSIIKRPLNIHLKVKRPDTPLVDRKKKRSGANLISSMLWLNRSSVSNQLDNIPGLFGK
jgi:hypothetical protein